MSSTEGPVKKTCPKCKQVDMTSFATCRSCGTRYDFVQEVKQKEVSLGWPLFLVVMLAAAGFSVYQYFQIQGTYAHPEKLIGKTMHCQQKYVLASISSDSLLKFDKEMAKAQKKDPQKFGSKGVAGALAAASVLNTLAAGGETSYSILYRYMRSGEVTQVMSDDGELVAVTVLGAKVEGDNSLVQVKLANGEKKGTVWWINSSDLDVATK